MFFNERLRIGNGINLNLIRTNKFKSNLISFYIIRPLSRKEVTKNVLIPLVLRRGTNKYKTNLEIERKLEYMYGSELSVDVTKKGERQILRFTIENPKGDYLNNENFLLEVIDLMKQIIYFPLLQNGVFNEQYVMKQKENLEQKIKGRINDKKMYALERCIEEMCKHEKFSIYKYGYIEDLDEINNINLYEHYKKILETSPIEIFLVGDFKENIINNISKIFTYNRKNIIDISREKIVGIIQTKNMIYEDMNVKQGKLIMGYRSSIRCEDKLYSALMLCNEILGGGPKSKLFINVREKESLCYYISSKMFKFKSIMMVEGGIDFNKYEKTIKIVRNQINEMKNGVFTEQDIDISKKSIANSIFSILDNNYLISEFFFSQMLSNDKRTLDDLIKDINNVNKDEIVRACNTINLDTIYFLGNNNYK